jgi:hypothetical protein
MPWTRDGMAARAARELKGGFHSRPSFAADGAKRGNAGLSGSRHSHHSGADQGIYPDCVRQLVLADSVGLSNRPCNWAGAGVVNAHRLDLTK